MSCDKIQITRMEALEAVHSQFGDHDEFDCYAVVPKDANCRCRVYFYQLPPNKANFPYHYHEVNHEVFYIISGQGIVMTESGEREIAPGDVISCPPTPGGAHKIANTSSTEPLVYLEFYTAIYPDIVHYPKTGTFGIIRRNPAENEFFPHGSGVDYARDVETPDKDW